MKKQFEGVTAITCKDGITTVEFEKEVNQQAEEEATSWPQPGDFVAVVGPKRSSSLGLFIHKAIDQRGPGRFRYHAARLPDGAFKIGCHDEFVLIGDDEIIRPATPSEQKMLEDTLLRVGKVWNPDTQRIERWRSDDLSAYNFIGSCGVETAFDCNDGYDAARFDSGNYFHPSEDTSRYEKAHRDIFKDRLI